MNPTEEYNAYLQWKLTDAFSPDLMTATDLNTELRKELKLKTASEKYQKQLMEQSVLESEQQRIAYNESVIREAISNGYVGNGSVGDFEKLFNYPEWFGDNWKEKASYEFESATDKVQRFIDLYVQYKR